MVGCHKDSEDLIVDGFAPVYIDFDVTKIKNEKPKPLISGTNFILYKTLIFLIEKNEGIHIVDNSNPALPNFISFIALPSVQHLTAAEDVLYINYGKDLVLVDISNINNVKFLSSVKGFFSTDQEEVPQDYAGYFECVDDKKGIIKSWEKKKLTNPRCKTVL
jgi:hypothetical protein